MKYVRLAVGEGGEDTRGDGTDGGGVFGMGRGRELATSCVSWCSCVVKAASIVLMLFLETFCFFVSSWRWCCRYPKASAMSWGCPEATTSGEQSSWRAGYNRGGRPIGWLVHWDSPELRF